MQLCYRGICYNLADSSVEITEHKLIGKYRGVPTRLTPSIATVQNQALVKLTYRGATYIGLKSVNSYQ
jgi:hypothetical protein